MAKRSCGSCALCCKVMQVPVIKPDDHDWCRHAQPGKSCGGCAIYATRPQACRDFMCMWVIDERFGAHWFPARSKIVINARIDPDVVAFIVDPDYPTRWREEPYFSDIREVAKAGLRGWLGKHWTTVVMIKGESIVIGR